MLARHEQEKKLKAILTAVKGIERHMQQQMVAQIETAEQALQVATAAILDHVTVPQGVGLDGAVNGLRVVRNQAMGWLEKWEQGIAKLPTKGTGISTDHLGEALDVGLGGLDAFPGHVILLYRALVADSQAHVLSAAEAGIANPGKTLANLQSEIESRLDENARAQDRLREALLSLPEHPLTVGLPALPSTSRRVAELDRTIARLSHSMVKSRETLPVLTSSGRQVLEAVRSNDGSVRLARPRTDAG